MKFKERFIRILIAVFKVLLILILGSFSIYFLSNFIFAEPEFIYLLLVIPVLLVVLFGVVAFTLTELLRLQSWYGDDMLHHYNRPELLSLYGRSFMVVSCGVGLALLFSAVYSDRKESVISYLFYLLDIFLTLYALGNIIKGEKIRELNMRRIQSENALLKSQLNPHFLYNTLNNIDALIAYDSDKASEAVIKLSSLLRYMTYQGNQKYVSLNEEMIHLHEYIALQQLRLENDNAVDFRVCISDNSLQIAPMLLMPFIENIFKHASDKKNDNSIKISIKADAHSLELYTENKAKQQINTHPKEGGMGLHVVKRRLKLLYPNSHILQIKQEQGLYITVLNLYFK